MNTCPMDLHQLGITAAAKYMQHIGNFDVLDRDWQSAAGHWDLVMLDASGSVDEIIFIDVDAKQFGMPVPGDMYDRKRRDMEHRAIAWIDAHRDVVTDARLRFDNIDIAVIGRDRAIVRHAVHVLGSMGDMCGDADDLIGGLQWLESHFGDREDLDEPPFDVVAAEDAESEVSEVD